MSRFDARSVTIAFAAFSIVALTAVLGIVFAQTQQTERVAAAAENRAQASTAFRLIESLDSRAEGALITVAAHNAELTGDVEQESAIAAVSEAQTAIANATSEAFNGSLAREVSIFIELLEDGDTDQARIQLDDVIGPIANRIQAESTATWTDAATVIEVETGVAGRWGLVTSFGVGLLAPLLMLTVFRLFVNRRRKQEKLEQELIRAKELGDAKDDMIGNLSHELRTPLTGILGFALTLEEMGFEDPNFAAEMNSYVVRDASDLNRMVEDLLVAAKVDNEGLNFSTEDIDLEREVDEALIAYKTSEKNITKDLEPSGVHADRLRSRQIIRNLISNADKHGGENLTIRGRSGNGRYLLEFIDDGDGVSEELSARLFSRFVHDGDAPLTTGSVGVGLSVAQALATGMDCTVAHSQEPGQTIFAVDFPLATDASVQEPDTSQPEGVRSKPEAPTPVVQNQGPSGTAPSKVGSPLAGPIRQQEDVSRELVSSVQAPATPSRVPAGDFDLPADPFA